MHPSSFIHPQFFHLLNPSILYTSIPPSSIHFHCLSFDSLIFKFFIFCKDLALLLNFTLDELEESYVNFSVGMAHIQVSFGDILGKSLLVHPLPISFLWFYPLGFQNGSWSIFCISIESMICRTRNIR